jgi:hypothetical protein
MRVQDVSTSVYTALKALTWQPSYLTAMWILCGELQSLYADRSNDEEAALMASTTDLVREVAIAGESPQAAGRAAELEAAWKRAINTRKAQASRASLRTLITFKALAQEIAGITRRYDGADWVTEAAINRWRDWNDPALVLYNPDEEVPDSSPIAQTLALFNRVVSEVAVMQGPEWDPVVVRTQIFGKQ